MSEEKKRPVSPLSGTPIPEGHPPWTREEAIEAGRKGGLKAAQTKKARKTLREELLMLLSDDITDKHGNKLKTQTAVSTALVKSAIGGNVKAFETIRDTIGEKPSESLTVAVSDMSALEEAFKKINDG